MSVDNFYFCFKGGKLQQCARQATQIGTKKIDGESKVSGSFPPMCSPERGQNNEQKVVSKPWHHRDCREQFIITMIGFTTL